VNAIWEVWLFPGMVTDVGETWKYPPVALPAQNVAPPRLILFNIKPLLFPAEFHVTCTSPMVIMSWGFVMYKLITLPLKMIEPVVILSHPGFAVGVLVGVKVRVGVNVSVGVDVAVAVDVTVGTSDGVLVGHNVAVAITSPGLVAVGVGVSVGVSVGVAEGPVVPVVVGTLDVGVLVELELGSSRSTYPRIVLALDEVRVRESIGMRFTMGL
jgi:hypothetical protein